MYSVKTKLASLGLAAMMLLGVAGCAAGTPTTVGTVGGVEIPAGVYLLAQYNAYNTASGLAELATGETANDVKTVLKASCTGTINGEEVTANGADYIAQLTDNAINYYAVVEKNFAEKGVTLDDAATAEAASTADSLWESNGELYTANGIGKASLQNYLLNSQKAQALLNLTYGPEGSDPVSEQEYEDYITGECYYLETVEFPLIDYTTYSFATEEQAAEIRDIAEQCKAELENAVATATAETAGNSAIYTAAMSYLPQAMAVLGSEMDPTQAVYYAGSQLFTPNDLAGYQESLLAPLDEAGMDTWITVEMGTSVMVARKVDPLANYTVDELVSMYGLLDSMKSEEFQTMLYDEGAALERALDAGAIKTYAASKIKRTV